MQRLQPFLSPHTNSTSSSSSSCSTFSLLNNCTRLSTYGFEFNFKVRRQLNNKGLLNFNRNRAVERESEFEVDPDKAREALRKLDQQLQSLSDKQISPPKIRVAASEVKRARDQITEEEPEFTGSFLPYAAFFLVIFTVFYNVLFFKVIKPSIDGPEPELSPPSVIMSIREASSEPQKPPPLLE